MKKLWFFVVVISLSTTLLTGFTAFATDVTIYVATNGNDTTNDGTFGSPFATIARAQQEVRAINANMQGNIIVNIEQGTYRLQNTLNFTTNDSGTNGHNVIYHGNNAILSGGQEVGNWVAVGNGLFRATYSDNDDLYDGTFEEATIAAAFTNKGFSSGGTVTLETTQAHSGTQSLKVTNRTNTYDSPNKFINTGSGVEVGKSYTASVWVKTVSGTDTCRVGIDPRNSTNVKIGEQMGGTVNINADTWTNVTHTYTSLPEGTAKVRAYLSTGLAATNILVDDFHFYETNNSPRQLYINGERKTRAGNNQTRICGIGWWDDPSTNYTTNDGIIVAGDALPDLTGATGLEIDRNIVWLHMRMPVERVDTLLDGRKVLVMKQPYFYRATTIITNHPWEYSTPFRIENAKVFIDTPGEWYHSTSEGMIYYKPQVGENITSAYVPKLEKIINFKGVGINNKVQNIVVEGLKIQHSAWDYPTNSGYCGWQAAQVFMGNNAQPSNGIVGSGVTLEHANNITLTGNIFEHFGGAGVHLINSVSNSNLTGNIFRDISASAVMVGLDSHVLIDVPEEEVCKNNEVSNNIIHDVAVEYWGNTGLFAFYTEGLKLNYNEIYDVPYSGISLGWGWSWAKNTYNSDVAKNNEIKGNRIYNYGTKLFDGGAIYTLGEQPGSVCSDNYITLSLHLHGIYHDEGSAFWTTENNFVDNPNNSKTVWLMINWVETNYDIVVINNFIYNSYLINNGTNITLDNNQVCSEGLPQGAVDVINSSGLQSSYEWLRVKNDPTFTEQLAKLRLYREQGSKQLFTDNKLKLNYYSISTSGKVITNVPVVFNSGNTTVIKVDNSGSAHALSAGETTITASAGNVVATYPIKVEEGNFYIGGDFEDQTLSSEWGFGGTVTNSFSNIAMSGKQSLLMESRSNPWVSPQRLLNNLQVGTSYTASAWVKAKTPTVGAMARIDFDCRDSNMTKIQAGQALGATVDLSDGEWKFISVDCVVVNGTAFARAIVDTVAGSNTTYDLYVDDFQLKRNADILYPVDSENLILNPSFEQPIFESQWQEFECKLTRDETVSRSGEASCLVTDGTLRFRGPMNILRYTNIKKDGTYRISAWVKSTVPTSTTAFLVLELRGQTWSKPPGYGPFLTNEVTLNGEWQKLTMDVTIGIENVMALVTYFSVLDINVNFYVDDFDIVLLDQTQVVTKTYPIDGERYAPVDRNIMIGFSGGMQQLTPSNVTINGTAISGTITKTATGDRQYINLTNPLEMGMEYVVIISGAKDLDGNVLEDFTFSFNTMESFAVHDIMFERDNIPTTEVKEGTYVPSLTIVNNKYSDYNVIFISALYESNELIEAKFKQIKVLTGVNRYRGEEIVVPIGNKHYNLGFFVWEDLVNLTPIAYKLSI